MDTAPHHLRSEDRPEFERALDDALHTDAVRDALHAPDARLNAEQLRTSALLAARIIADAAAPEYQRYLELRRQAREAAAAPGGRGGGARGGAAPQIAAAGGGAGAVPAMTVLVPILAGAAALIFLLIGYVLHTADRHLTFATSLITAGWVSLAVGAATTVIAIVGLLLTALRDGSTPPDGQDPELHARLTEAREAWKEALRDRGIVPFLLDTLESAPADPSLTDGVDLVRHRPRLGYSSPGFTSPGPEGITDGDGHRQRPSSFSSPDYTSPRFTSPDFTSPNYQGPEAPTE